MKIFNLFRILRVRWSNSKLISFENVPTSGTKIGVIRYKANRLNSSVYDYSKLVTKLKYDFEIPKLITAQIQTLIFCNKSKVNHPEIDPKTLSRPYIT